MRVFISFLAILVISISCDDSGLHGEEDSSLRHSKRIKLLRTIAEDSLSKDEAHFQYDGDILAGVKYVSYYRQDLNSEFGYGETRHEYKYSNGLLTEILNAEYPESPEASITYNQGQLSKISWYLTGRHSTDSYKYNSAGQIDSLIGYWSYPASISETSWTKVKWNADNAEKYYRKTLQYILSNGTSNVYYDTVSYEYGDKLNPFNDPLYLGYIMYFRNEAILPYLSKNILTKAIGTYAIRTLEYEFDQDNFPIRITETYYSDWSTPRVYTKEIEYE
jgi:hypothetical protein